MMNNDTLKERMKSLQKLRDYRLNKDSYIICHIDGRAFSKMIKNKFNLPFDDNFIHMMDETAAYICQNVQGARLAYVQSDEITIILTAFKCDGEDVVSSGAFFDYRLCKMQSIIASLATAKFNQLLALLHIEEHPDIHPFQLVNEMSLIQFDCKCWDVDRYEDMFAWLKFRQNDCIRNSKQQFCQTYCPHKSLLNLDSDKQVEYCKETTGNDWNALSIKYKYGRLVYRTVYDTQVKNPKTGELVDCKRSQYSAWLIDEPFTFDEFRSWELVPYKKGEV